MNWVKRILTLVGLIIISYDASAIGGAWCAEIHFEYEHKETIGYVLIDPDLIDVDSAGFDQLFHERFKAAQTIEVYSNIKDQASIAEYASFPMHSYELGTEDFRSFEPKKMKNIRRIRTWSRIEYHIRVLTPIFESDTTWIDGASKIIYPNGQEVGCRLEVHVFDKNPDPSLIDELVISTYNERAINQEELEKKTALLLALKAKQIVVVELCGC